MGLEKDEEHAIGGSAVVDGAEQEDDGADDSGVGAAVALLVALSSFLVAVALVIFRHSLFHG